MSQIVMQSSRDDLRKWLQTKFDPIIEANPKLISAYAKPRGREGVNNSIMKSFSGGDLILAWSGSASTARGVSAPIVICDEVDAYEYLKEGHPVDLVWQRAATFGGDKKLLEISTPTVENVSRISDSYADGDMREFYVVCSACKAHWTLDWDFVKWGDRRTRNRAYPLP